MDIFVDIHWADAMALMLFGLTGFLMVARIGCFGCNTPVDAVALNLSWPQKIFDTGADRIFRLKYTGPMPWRGLTSFLMLARIGCFGLNTPGRCRGVDLVVASPIF